MYYVYFDNEGNVISCTNELSKDNKNKHIPVSEETFLSIATSKKFLQDFVVIKTISKYVLVEKKDESIIDYDKSSNTIEKGTESSNGVNILQNLHTGEWYVKIDMENDQTVYQTQIQKNNKVFYVVDSNDSNRLIDKFSVDLLKLLEAGSYKIDIDCNLKDISLMCFRADEKYIHVQTEAL